MTTRCNPGDLAVITHDFPSCAANIGRIVAVSGPAEVDRNGRLAWLIRPVTDEPYMICDHDGNFLRFMSIVEKNIEHPDEWMSSVQSVTEPAQVAQDAIKRES